MASDEPELALRAYYRAAGELGLNADVLSALGSANLRLGRIGQAEALLRQALEEEEEFVPALNNLGVVLMERREYGEARRVFQQAFALDSGRTDAIRENLRLAIARMEDSVYDGENTERQLDLIRRGPGVYELLSTVRVRAENPSRYEADNVPILRTFPVVLAVIGLPPVATGRRRRPCRRSPERHRPDQPQRRDAERRLARRGRGLFPAHA
jgi:tetratricopeptide (TPR) repeat protein